MAYLTVSEFAESEGVSRSTVRRWISRGLPAAVGPAGEIVISEDEAADWLDCEFDSEGEDDGLDDEDEEQDEGSVIDLIGGDSEYDE